MSDPNNSFPEIGSSSGVDEGYPTNTVIGVINDPQATHVAVTALSEMPIVEDTIDVVCTESVVEQLNAYRADRPWKARVAHFLMGMSDELELQEKYGRWLDEGSFIIRVPIPDQEQAETVATVMREQGGHFIHYYGPSTITTLVP